MAYLGDIITGINTAIKAKLTAFPTALYEGIAYSLVKKEGKGSQSLPAIIDTKGDAKWITFDDIREMIIYHKINSSTYSVLKGESYGDGHNMVRHIYEIDLFVMADRKRVGITPDVLEAAVASNIPYVLPLLNGLNYMEIVTVNANHNSRQLFGQEYPGVDYYLKPEHIFFSIRYRIELKYQKGCISLCQCN